MFTLSYIQSPVHAPELPQHAFSDCKLNVNINQKCDIQCSLLAV